MTSQDELKAYLADYLEVNQFNDYAPNGLQVEGRQEIRIIRTAVTASQTVIDKAVADKADALLVHHGYFWRGESPVISGMKQRRIKALLSNDLNLFAYHLPIDCHQVLGNNACLADQLKLKSAKGHMVQGTPNLLWTGELTSPQMPDAFQETLTQCFGQKPQFVLDEVDQPKPIKRIAFCTGAAQDLLTDAKRLGVDAYLSGEISERTYYEAKEQGIHYFACGHHATERFGIQALGAHLAEQFGLNHAFIDSNNPV